jgi:peptide deformylase
MGQASHPAIVTDPVVLHTISGPASKNDTSIIHDLVRIRNQTDGLGLSAIQIGIAKRIFLAKTSKGTFILFNPSLELNDVEAPSMEGCLSLPGVTRRVNRYSEVTVNADNVFNVDAWTDVEDLPLEFLGRDAAIIQHENDHLNGILITDRPEVVLPEDKLREKHQKRMEKVHRSRMAKRSGNRQMNSNLRSKKNQDKIDQELKRHRKQMDKRVEIQERFRSELEGLI